MHRLSARSHPGLRLFLALALLLAGLAGARMQGTMAAQSALGLGILCSGAATPVHGDAPDAAGHAGCLACPLPLAAAPDAPQVPVRVPFRVEKIESTPAFAAPAGEPAVVHCRGPPLAG